MFTSKNKRLLASGDHKSENAQYREHGIEPDRPPIKLLWVLIIVLVVVLGIIGAAAEQIIWMTSAGFQRGSVVIDPRVQELREKDTAELTSYNRLEREDGSVTYQIPIERTFEILEQSGTFEGAGLTSVAPPSASEAAALDPAELGRIRFENRGCNACHTADGTQSLGPTMAGLFGAQRTFEDGSTAVADEAYIRESILEPAAKIVQGYPPVMPSYAGQLSDEDIDVIIAYIRSLTP